MSDRGDGPGVQDTVSGKAVEDWSAVLGLRLPSDVYRAARRGRQVSHPVGKWEWGVQIHDMDTQYMVSWQQPAGYIYVFDIQRNDSRLEALIPQLAAVYDRIYQRVRRGDTMPLAGVKYRQCPVTSTAYDSGVHACAHAYSLVQDVDPRRLALDESRMLEHLYQCLMDKEPRAFPAQPPEPAETCWRRQGYRQCRCFRCRADDEEERKRRRRSTTRESSRCVIQ